MADMAARPAAVIGGKAYVPGTDAHIAAVKAAIAGEVAGGEGSGEGSGMDASKVHDVLSMRRFEKAIRAEYGLSKKVAREVAHYALYQGHRLVSMYGRGDDGLAYVHGTIGKREAVNDRPAFHGKRERQKWATRDSRHVKREGVIVRTVAGYTYLMDATSATLYHTVAPA